MTDQERAAKIFQQFKDHFDKEDFSYDAFDDDLVIRLTVHGKDLPQPTLIKIDEKRKLVRIMSPIPTDVPEDKVMDMALATSVANYRIINGCFDLYIKEGKIIFRIVHYYGDTELSEAQLEYLTTLAFLVTDDYNDSFFMISKGIMSVEDFIAKETADN